jgi:DNA-binding response OmpR family regulator
VQMRCVWLPNAEQALGAATQAVFDALLIDASETEADAQMLAGLRAVFRCPLVVLASQVNDIDEIIALEAGADAYLLRSSPARLLRARLTALLRQHRHRPLSAPSQAALLEYAGWHLDRVTNALTRHGQVLDLSEAQGAMLQCLMWARGAIVSRERLAASIHHAPRVGLRSIDVYVHRLRKRLTSQFDTGLLIESERRRGYRLSSVAPGFDTAR